MGGDPDEKKLFPNLQEAIALIVMSLERSILAI